MWSAPAASAAAGVAVRFWSPGSAPTGRMPGVTISLPTAAGSARRRAASRGEAMTPSAPAAKARRARSSTISGSIAVADQGRVQVGAVERGENGDGEDAGRGLAAAGDGGGDDVRVTVDGEEIGRNRGGQAADGGGDGGADVEELHVEEDALAAGAKLAGEIEAAGGQQAEADLVEADVLAEARHQRAGGVGVGQVEAHDQAVVRHGSGSRFRGCAALGKRWCQASGRFADRARARPAFPLTDPGLEKGVRAAARGPDAQFGENIGTLCVPYRSAFAFMRYAPEK